MKRLLLRRGAWAALLLAASAALSQPAAFAERYSPIPASTDGIGKRYMGREISAVMGWQGAAWLEREERDREERTDLLLAGAKRSGLTQVEARLGAVDDVRLPAGSVDLAIMVDVHHELAYPYEVMASVMKALKPGGRVVFVEYKAEYPRVPIKPLHKMSEAQIKREAAVFALHWERTVSTLPWQHVVVFRKRS